MTGLTVKTGGRLNAGKALQQSNANSNAVRTVSGDFNGDGKTDIAQFSGDGYLQTKINVKLSNGTGYGNWQTWSTDNSYSLQKIFGRIIAGDFNGDNKDDIAAMYNYWNSEMQVHLFTSTGFGFTNSSWYNETPGNYFAENVSSRMCAGDYNNDGKCDIVSIYNYGNMEQIYILQSNGASFSKKW